MSWWDAVRNWFRGKRKGDFPEPNRENPDSVQHFTGREDWIRRRKNLTTALGSREISEEMDAKIRAQSFSRHTAPWHSSFFRVLCFSVIDLYRIFIGFAMRPYAVFRKTVMTKHSVYEIMNRKKGGGNPGGISYGIRTQAEGTSARHGAVL